MKKAFRIITPIILIIALLFCSGWYLFIYDRDFTRDMLLSCARFTEAQGNHKISTFFYNCAYSHANDDDSVAIELAEQYKNSGNFTKAEYTLTNAIADGGGIELYIALCKTFVQQDKLRDAVLLLDNITDEDIKKQLEVLRPAAPVVSPEPGFYNQYISLSFDYGEHSIYAALNTDYPSVDTDEYVDPITLTEGENSLCAVAVSENGLVSPRAYFSYTVGGIVKEVEFLDPVLEDYIRAEINVSDITVLYSNDLWGITDLTIPEGVLVYDDLQHMIYLEQLTIEDAVADQLDVITGLTNLQSLRITNTIVSNDLLKGISALPNLTELTLSGCNLSNISPLAAVSGLIKLDLSNNTIRNLDALQDMSNLEELNLQRNAITDLSALAQLTNLQKLDVSFNAMQSLDSVYSVTSLIWLDASNNAIAELGSIDQLADLSYLAISSNDLTDISNVVQCATLAELNISNNMLTDISALKDLSMLTYLNFSNNTVTTIPAFSQDSRLVTIDGSHNSISSLAPLAGLKSLNTVNMDYNKDIKSVAELKDCPLLIEVNVYATAVTEVSMLTDLSIVVNFNPVQETTSSSDSNSNN